jgi:hypothetical protein
LIQHTLCYGEGREFIERGMHKEQVMVG